ncbi:hypothetical protein GCM10010275_13460 [Streptomyces litmocidini]|uniref:hypothetical protein n=1 Tax=Streptomyces litmocidini TaxID=67318 RepID=UPI00167DB93B|nr:hypothetical protein [Streptomyces litmocidini]GGU80070.1 hypothetical protein GCM10010275_13460 [Streptomyces litmocidini]
MGISRRQAERRRGSLLPLVVATAAVTVLATLGITGTSTKTGGQALVTASYVTSQPSYDSDFMLLEPTYTTAQIHQKGLNIPDDDTGVVVPYYGPLGWNPGAQKNKDWIGIYEKGQLDAAHRIDWDWVCPNEIGKCASFGAAVVPAGNDGLASGKTYTVAYWVGAANESKGRPAATVDFVIPW